MDFSSRIVSLLPLLLVPLLGWSPINSLMQGQAMGETSPLSLLGAAGLLAGILVWVIRQDSRSRVRLNDSFVAAIEKQRQEDCAERQGIASSAMDERAKDREMFAGMLRSALEDNRRALVNHSEEEMKALGILIDKMEGMRSQAKDHYTETLEAIRKKRKGE